MCLNRCQYQTHTPESCVALTGVSPPVEPEPAVVLTEVQTDWRTSHAEEETQKFTSQETEGEYCVLPVCLLCPHLLQHAVGHLQALAELVEFLLRGFVLIHCQFELLGEFRALLSGLFTHFTEKPRENIKHLQLPQQTHSDGERNKTGHTSI